MNGAVMISSLDHQPADGELLRRSTKLAGGLARGCLRRCQRLEGRKLVYDC